MKTIVPEQLSFAAQPVDWQGRLHQSFTLELGFDLLSGRTLPPDAAFGAAMQALEGGGLLDTGLPKKEAEWLLAAKTAADETRASAEAADASAKAAQEAQEAIAAAKNVASSG